MTLRSLEIFLQVCDSGGMLAAARELYISAPSVSGVIAELERECGLLLFERFGRGLRITPAGEQLREHARHVLGAYREMEAQMTAFGKAARLRIGATMTIASSVLIPLLRILPPPAARVTVQNTRIIEKMLLQGELDVALVEDEVTDKHLLSEPILADTLVLCCNRSHPFTTRTGVTIKEVASEPLLMRESGSGTRALFERELQKCRLTPNILWECGSITALLDAVASGFGVSVISKRLIPPALCAIPITDATLSRAFHLTRHIDKYLSAPLATFIAQCRQLGAAGGGDDEGCPPSNS